MLSGVLQAVWPKGALEQGRGALPDPGDHDQQAHAGARFGRAASGPLFFDISRFFSHTPAKRRVFLEAPVKYEAKKADAVWEFEKAMYSLEEAAVEFHDHFDSTVAGNRPLGGRPRREATPQRPLPTTAYSSRGRPASQPRSATRLGTW